MEFDGVEIGFTSYSWRLPRLTCCLYRIKLNGSPRVLFFAPRVPMDRRPRCYPGEATIQRPGRAGEAR